MAVVINGDTGISPVTASGTSASVDGMTVGRGGGEVSTNTAVGASALTSNSTGASNTAIGYQAGYNITTPENTFLGYQAGLSGSSSGTGGNTVIGYGTGGALTSGARNTLIGYAAGSALTTGSRNTFVGNRSGSADGAGFSVTTGSANTIIGGYGGNQGGLDIRTLSNRVVLSDGDGNPRLYADNNGAWQSTSAIGNGTLYPAFFCRAWVWFNGADASIFGSGNVSSVTRLANGSYTVNFTTAFPDNLYTGVTGFSRIDASAQFVNLGFSRTSSTDRVETFVGGGNAALSTIQIAYFR